MCNYADDIKTPSANASLGADVTKAAQPASINPATSGVTAGSGPDMWEPMTIGIFPSILHHQAAHVVLGMAGIGHKPIAIHDDAAGDTVGIIVKTSDVPAISEIVGDHFLPIFDLSPADYRGGGKHRRPIVDLTDPDTTGYLVQRGEDFARKQPVWFATIPASGDTSQANFFAVLTDAETRNCAGTHQRSQTVALCV